MAARFGPNFLSFWYWRRRQDTMLVNITKIRPGRTDALTLVPHVISSEAKERNTTPNPPMSNLTPQESVRAPTIKHWQHPILTWIWWGGQNRTNMSVHQSCVWPRRWTDHVSAILYLFLTVNFGCHTRILEDLKKGGRMAGRVQLQKILSLFISVIRRLWWFSSTKLQQHRKHEHKSAQITENVLASMEGLKE